MKVREIVGRVFRSALFVGIVLSFSFAILTAFVSNNLHPRFEHREETIQEQLAILQGQSYVIDGKLIYFPEFQNRVLFPALLTAASLLRPSALGGIYLILRLLTIFLAFLVFWFLLLLVGSVSPRTAALGLGALAYVLIFTFNHGWEHPTDVLDVIFISLLLALCLRKRRLAVILVTVLASANRESSPFVGVIWLALYGISAGRKLNRSEIAFGLGLMVVGVVSVLSIRYLFGGAKAFAPQTMSIFLMGSFLHDAIAPLSPSSWLVLLVAMILPLAVWIGSNRQRLTGVEKRLLLAGIAIACIAPIFGIIEELRFFIPAAVILIFVACCADSNRQ